MTQTKKQKTNRNLKQNFSLCGAAAFAALFLFSGVMLARQNADQKQSAEAFDEVVALIQEEPAPIGETADPTIETEPAEEATEEAVPTLTAYETYAAVYGQNLEFVGWISIEGTNINYPVMQSVTKPNFYLKHGFDSRVEWCACFGRRLYIGSQSMRIAAPAQKKILSFVGENRIIVD